jgi:hypothetical protein
MRIQKTAFACSFIAGVTAASQTARPTIQARSAAVDIRDGETFKKGHWKVSPDVKPDVYVADRFQGRKRVVFYTDLDSVAVEVEPNRLYDFTIVLNGTDSAPTRISTLPAPALPYRRLCVDCVRSTDTIPFRLGWNNSIMVVARINDSPELDLMFDTGANGIVVSEKALGKDGAPIVEREVAAYGLGGASTVKLSRRNRLAMGTIAWDSVSLVMNTSGGPNADGVIGYNVFDQRVVEIDYDQSVLVIHPSLPVKASGYVGYPLRFHDGLSFIELALDVGGRIVTGWFDFDTGSSGGIFLHKAFAETGALHGAMEHTGFDRLKGQGPNRVAVDNVVLPSLRLANATLRHVPTNVELPTSAQGPPFNIVGNDVLKRFNAIVDYQHDTVYLTPSSHLHSWYMPARVRTVKAGLAALAFIVAGTAIASILRRRSRKRIS